MSLVYFSLDSLVLLCRLTYEWRNQLELLPQKLIEQLAILFQKVNYEGKGWFAPSYQFWDSKR
ncbi:MAG: hypothetical protein V7L11_15655 [Nostoc sp.]|uniref:hypothetical protein n=1 Tax=Nostoc sp. TaxID=1180 RepID=UPI002FFA3774